MLQKIALLGASVVALSLTATTVTQAHAFGPGLWSANGIQEICLKSDGTWYSPTFGSWGGVWLKQTVTGLETGTLVGNYNSGAGNDSMVIKRSVFTWNEWSDDLSYVNLAGVGYVWSYLGSSCGAPATGPNKHANPMDR
jgi:hypothetical protein